MLGNISIDPLLNAQFVFRLGHAAFFQAVFHHLGSLFIHCHHLKGDILVGLLSQFCIKAVACHIGIVGNFGHHILCNMQKGKMGAGAFRALGLIQLGTFTAFQKQSNGGYQGQRQDNPQKGQNGTLFVITNIAAA